jgi:hypothetical protein
VAASLQIPRLDPSRLTPAAVSRPDLALRLPSQVFRGRELTPKTRRIASGLAPLDRLIDGGIVRGRISEIVGPASAGKTSLAMAFAATVTRIEAAAWIETHDSLDPASLYAAGVEPARLLWVSCATPHLPSRKRPVLNCDPEAKFRNGIAGTDKSASVQNKVISSLKTAEWILAAGGFGLIVIDFDTARYIPQSAALRLARAAERSGAGLIVLARQRICGTFAVLSLELARRHAIFNRIAPGAGATFDGQALQAEVTRNKLGESGGIVRWQVVADPYSVDPNDDPAQHARPSSILIPDRSDRRGAAQQAVGSISANRRAVTG